MTKVINLLAGSGCSKTTLSAGIFYEMKKRGINCELVSEFVKRWAWIGTKVGAYDQVYLFGKQAKSEYDLYGKVDYIVTDSPLILSPIYEKFYNGYSVIESAVKAHLDKAHGNGVEHINFLISRTKPFDTRGRYETEEQAREVDKLVENYLLDNNLNFHRIESIETDDKVSEILKTLGIK